MFQRLVRNDDGGDDIGQHAAAAQQAEHDPSQTDQRGVDAKELSQAAAHTAELAVALAPAVARQVALAVGWLLLFAAGFIVFKLVCRLLIWLLDLLDEVPGLHFLNHLGGAALGVLKGGLLIAVVVSILLWCDVLPRSMVDTTLLLRWLASLGPVY